MKVRKLAVSKFRIREVKIKNLEYKLKKEYKNSNKRKDQSVVIYERITRDSSRD